jgi:DNA-binding NarL/FixJ family response regulator
MLRILVADEHDVVRHGLRVHLEAEPNWQVVAEAADGKEAILQAIETKPDVVVLAYKLPLVDGIEATLQIRAQLPKTEVLIYTAHKNENLMGYILQAGARGCVFKSEPISHLIDAVRSVGNHRLYFGAIPSQREIAKAPNGTGSPLTNRERTVVQQIAEGHSNKEIARTLGISLKTVETHRAKVMSKLECHSSAELVRYAVRNGFVMA